MRIACAAFALAASASAGAEDARWYLKTDNDVAFGTDRWYSSSVRIARVKDGIELGLVQDVYTPAAKDWRPGHDDRVPVGRLLASGAMHGEGPGYFQTLELALGVRGPAALGRQATTAIHHLISAPHVDWSRQLENRFDASLAFTRTQAVVSDRFKLHGGATLGNQLSFAHAGFEVRAGNPAFSSAVLRFAPTPPFATGVDAGWSAYAGASIRVIGHNELLSRNYDPFGPDLESRRSMTRVAAGVAWTRGWGTLALDVAQDSKEYDAQFAPQRFGSLSVHVPF